MAFKVLSTEEKEVMMKGMDDAAKVAEADLATIEADIVITMANWWGRHYLKAGHKRLGRVLATIAKQGLKD